MAFPSPKTKIYTAPLVHTPAFGTLTILPTASIGVSPTGTILFIATDAPSLAASLVTHSLTASNTSYHDFTSSGSSVSSSSNASNNDNGNGTVPPSSKNTPLLLPGLIDTHTHAPQYPNTGILGSSTLLSWLERYTFPTESSFTSTPTPSIPNPTAHTTRIYTRVIARLLAAGTTTAAYHATLHVDATNTLADLCLQAGQRALVGRVCMDRLSPPYYRDASVSAAIADSKACIAHCRAIDPTGELVRPCITPRFAPACSGAVLRALGELQGEESGAEEPGGKVWAQTHISENGKEIALVRELFPDSKDYASVYDDAGLLNDHMLLAHAVHLSPAEVALISARGAKVSHCPSSNTALTSGAARVKHLVRQGIDVGLGTDMSGGYSPSILEMAKQALLVSRHVAMTEGDEHKLSVEEVLYLATLGGAKAVGLEDRVGSFEVGKEFDAQLIRLEHVSEDGVLGKDDRGPVDMLGSESWEDLLAKWVWTGDDRNVRGVWVKGRLVHNLEDLVESPLPEAHIST